MGLFKGGALRIMQSFLYLLAFACAAIVLGIMSYFLSLLADRSLFIARDFKAVEGISGIIVVYTLIAAVLGCCLGGVTFFALLGIVLDICMLAGFVALAILLRDGTRNCSAYGRTPIGTGFPNDYPPSNNDITISVRLGTACRLTKAAFAVSIIGIFIMLLTVVGQFFLMRHHKKEKRFGPGPSNGYTSGSRRKGLFARKNKHATRDVETAAVPAGGLAAAHPDTRPSHETGTTLGANAYTNDKVEPTGAHTGYYTQPTGTGAVNPYGYQTQTTTTTGTSTHVPTHGTATNY